MSPSKVIAVMAMIYLLNFCTADCKDYPPEWANQLLFPNQFFTTKRLSTKRGDLDLRGSTLLERMTQVAKRLDRQPYEMRGKFMFWS